jgi:hypothetical protein
MALEHLSKYTLRMDNDPRPDGIYATRFGAIEWWLNGRRHLPDGPAIIHCNGDEEWWLNGRRHRRDGPAVIHRWKSYQYKNRKIETVHIRSKQWYYNGRRDTRKGSRRRETARLTDGLVLLTTLLPIASAGGMQPLMDLTLTYLF